MARGENLPPAAAKTASRTRRASSRGVYGHELDSGFAQNARNQRVAVGGFADRAGGHGGVFRDAVTVQHIAKLHEGLDRARHRARVQAPPGEYAVAEAHRPARVRQFANFRRRDARATTARMAFDPGIERRDQQGGGFTGMRRHLRGDMQKATSAGISRDFYETSITTSIAVRFALCSVMPPLAPAVTRDSEGGKRFAQLNAT